MDDIDALMKKLELQDAVIRQLENDDRLTSRLTALRAMHETIRAIVSHLESAARDLRAAAKRTGAGL